VKEIIKPVIESIPKGMIFDTHMVIEYLLQNNSDEYLKNCGERSTLSYHGHIGQIIDEIAKEGLAKKIGKSWSINIRKSFSECTCWEKL
jgi:hypothetical protein